MRVVSGKYREFSGVEEGGFRRDPVVDQEKGRVDTGTDLIPSI